MRTTTEQKVREIALFCVTVGNAGQHVDAKKIGADLLTALGEAEECERRPGRLHEAASAVIAAWRRGVPETPESVRMRELQEAL